MQKLTSNAHSPSPQHYKSTTALASTEAWISTSWLPNPQSQVWISIRWKKEWRTRWHRCTWEAPETQQKFFFHQSLSHLITSREYHRVILSLDFTMMTKPPKESTTLLPSAAAAAAASKKPTVGDSGYHRRRGWLLKSLKHYAAPLTVLLVIIGMVHRHLAPSNSKLLL